MTLRAFAAYVLVFLGLVVLVLVAWKLLPVLMLVFGGVVLASAIRAASEPMARRLRWPHAVTVTLVMLAVLAVFGAAGYFFGRELGAQVDALTEATAVATEKAKKLFAGWPLAQAVVDEVRAVLNPENVAKLAKGTLGAFGALADLVLVIMLALYLAANPDAYRRGVIAPIPEPARGKVGRAFDASGDTLRRWLLAQLLAMVGVGLAVGLGLWAIGVPLALPLGILSGLLEFVPIIGPLAAAVPGVLIALAQSPELAFYAALVYMGVQFVESNLLLPLVQGWAVELPPGLALVGVVAFGVLFGLPGILLAMPLLVVTVTMVQRLYVNEMPS